MFALLEMAVLYKYRGLILFGVLVWVSWKVYVVQVEPWLRERRLNKRAEQAALELRADHENREWLQAGLYEGRYPAATLPLVTNGQLTGWYEYTDEPHEPRDWYDYDDGLTDWR